MRTRIAESQFVTLPPRRMLHRLLRILQDPWRRRRLPLFAAIGVALVVLAMQPGYAQEVEPTPDPVTPQVDPEFAEYFASRGGIETFGYPLGDASDLLGFKTQIFQRRVIQLGPDGNPRLLNLLDQGLMPYTRINGSTFPPPDPALADQAPKPDEPDYPERALEFVRQHAPDQFEGQPVAFFQAFDSTVTCEMAFPDLPCDEGLRALMNLEMWGLPTSLPAADPTNPNFVYQRFQRGIMHYDAGCECTQGILLGSYFTGVLMAAGLPPDLELQARTSPLYGHLRPGGAPVPVADPGAPPSSTEPSRPPVEELPALLPDLPTRRGPIVEPQPAPPPPTAVPSPASSPVPSPIPPPPPASTNRDDFGVIVSGRPTSADVTHLVSQLGMRWWYAFLAPNTGPNPENLNRVRLLHTGRKLTPISDAALADVARANRGAAWLIGNEPNVPGQDDVPPETYAEQFHRFRAAIKAGDPSAIIVAPNVLNWDFTCSACGGYTSGHAFVERFRNAYRQRYGAEPPVDVWGVHIYDVDWANLPMTRVDRAKQDLRAAREFLRSIPEHANDPIWVTEFGVIWAFDSVQSVQVQGRTVLQPAGSYSQARVNAYITDMVGWLRTTGRELGIARSFLYATKPDPEPYANVAAGISLFDAPGAGARLTPSGEAYRSATAD